MATNYFEKNAKRIQTQFQVWQIFYRGKDSQMAELLKDLRGGVHVEKEAPPIAEGNHRANPRDEAYPYPHKFNLPDKGLSPGRAGKRPDSAGPRKGPA